MRNFKTVRMTALRTLAFGLMVGPLLGGCLNNDPNIRWLITDESPPWLWSKEAKPRANKPTVKWTQLAHTVAFQPGQAKLSAPAAQQIDRFLSQVGARGGTATIVLGVPETAKDQKLAADRGAAVSAFLRRRSVRVGAVNQVPGAASANSVTVLVGRNIVQMPNCPNWERTLNTGNKAPDVDRRQFGCMHTASLGAMVADPRDLVRGRDPGATDAGTAARAYKGYLEGKFDTQGLTKESTTGAK